MQKFNRSYELDVEAIDGTIVPIRAPLTIEFDIDRNILSSANNATISVKNLAAATRNNLYKDKIARNVYRSIQLRAGYDGHNPIIFKGNITACYSIREGTEFTTTFECLDAGFAFATGQVSKNISVPTGANPKLNKTIDELIAALPKIAPGAIGDFSQDVKRGNSFSGSPAEIIQQLTGNSMFVDNEIAHVLKANECIEGGLPTISADTGLLNAPQREESSLVLKMLFEPRLLIGQKLTLESADNTLFNGEYKVVAVHHSGVISEAVAGPAQTEVTLWYGPQLLKIVSVNP